MSGGNLRKCKLTVALFLIYDKIDDVAEIGVVNHLFYEKKQEDSRGGQEGKQEPQYGPVL